MRGWWNKPERTPATFGAQRGAREHRKCYLAREHRKCYLARWHRQCYLARLTRQAMTWQPGPSNLMCWRSTPRVWLDFPCTLGVGGEDCSRAVLVLWHYMRLFKLCFARLHCFCLLHACSLPMTMTRACAFYLLTCATIACCCDIMSC